LEVASAVLADVAIILFLVGCVLFGVFRGAVRQLLAVGAWLVAFVVAAQGRGFLADWLLAQEPDFSDRYALMLGFLIGFAVLLVAALVLVELSGRTITISSSPLVEEIVGGGVLLFVGLLVVTGLLIALGTHYSAGGGEFTAEVDLVTRLSTALNDSNIARVLRDTLVPAVQTLLGPLLPADVRSFG
jgi:membrane protein required for colicin V production